MECFPAFNYARDKHEITVAEDGRRATFKSKDLTLELLSIIHHDADITPCQMNLRADDESRPKMLGAGAVSHVSFSFSHDELLSGLQFEMSEGQVVTFILREPIEQEVEEIATHSIDSVLSDTSEWWTGWIASSKYTGRWREFVLRSAITLKLLTFEPTGAIVAAATCERAICSKCDSIWGQSRFRKQ
jgi:hypothetical protein